MSDAFIDHGRLIFLHIPKTAGTSLHDVLTGYFRKEEICPERRRDLSHKPPEYFEPYRFFSGHFTAESIAKVPGRKFAFTILRHPYERIMSLYYFWRRHRDAVIQANNLAGPRLARQVNVKEFLSTDLPIPRNYIKNEMTRVLAGDVFTEKDDTYFELKDGKRIPIEKFEIIRRATATLNQLDFVFFVETLDRDFPVLCKMLGMDPVPKFPRKNTRDEVRPDLETVREEALDDDHIRLLKRNTDLDRIIYSLARVRRADVLRRQSQDPG
ncbi:sulfotransferase family 2 domain-containing protein [Roseococcus thiosulfatophilus]|uniref:sulfotransferase family 2 domain-containing protein n=1 Tax=Roseococcus thiosulfatophilus TaxID=35813 RepID=UPI001A8BFBB1|nr:sulfotransferase family 2 domain-containing protein [Roseococcus thiosulfatophilus]